MIKVDLDSLVCEYDGLWHVIRRKANIGLATVSLLSYCPFLFHHEFGGALLAVLLRSIEDSQFCFFMAATVSTLFSQLTLSTSRLFKMLAFDFPIIIRDAKIDEFETIGNLDRACFVNSDRYWQLVFSHMDPLTWLEWLWIDGARKGVVDGHDRVLVIERTDTKEIIGHAWYCVYNEVNRPSMPASYPEGLNKLEPTRIAFPRFQWLKQLVKEYRKIMCPYLIWL